MQSTGVPLYTLGATPDPSLPFVFLPCQNEAIGSFINAPVYKNLVRVDNPYKIIDPSAPAQYTQIDNFPSGTIGINWNSALSNTFSGLNAFSIDQINGVTIPGTFIVNSFPSFVGQGDIGEPNKQTKFINTIVAGYFAEQGSGIINGNPIYTYDSGTPPDIGYLTLDNNLDVVKIETGVVPLSTETSLIATIQIASESYWGNVVGGGVGPVTAPGINISPSMTESVVTDDGFNPTSANAGFPGVSDFGISYFDLPNKRIIIFDVDGLTYREMLLFPQDADALSFLSSSASSTGPTLACDNYFNHYVSDGVSTGAGGRLYTTFNNGFVPPIFGGKKRQFLPSQSSYLSGSGFGLIPTPIYPPSAIAGPDDLCCPRLLTDY